MDTTGGNQPIYHKKTFENIPEEKRRRILAAAIGEFANKGFDNANINVIASKAGVSVGSLYKYFNTKQDLFLTAVHHGISILEETLGPLSQADMDVRDKLELIIRTVQTTSRQLEDLIKLYNEMTSENNAELVRLISQDMETVSAAVYTQVIAQAQQEGLTRRDVDPRMFAFCLITSLQIFSFPMPAAIIRSGLKFMQARISFPAMILLWNKCSNLLKARLQRAWGRKRLPGVNESSGEPP